MAEFALAIMSASGKLSADKELPLTFRIGMHTGSIIGGVIGREKAAYDYWGRTVNLASRLEATALPGTIQMSEASFWRLHGRYVIEKRGEIEMKGFGVIPTYLLLARSADSGASEEKLAQPS